MPLIQPPSAALGLPNPNLAARFGIAPAPPQRPMPVIAAPGPAPRAYNIPGIQPPAVSQPSAELRSPGIASPAALPPAALVPSGTPMAPMPKIASPAALGPSPDALALQRSKDAEAAIKPPSYTGKLGVLEKIGDVAGRLFAPGIEQRLGVGTIGYEDRLARAEGQTDRLEKQQAAEAATDKADADADLATANANRVANEPEPEASAEQQSYDALVKSGVDPVEAFRRVTQAATHVPPARLESVTLAGPGGKPVKANFDPATGVYTDISGKPIANPVPYAAPTAPRLLTGTLNGKPAFAELVPGAGFVDPTTRQPIVGFAPAAASDRLTGMGAYTLSRILQEETSDNPAIRVLLPSLLDRLGISLTPEQRAQIEAMPAGQPVNDAGTAIGTRMPAAPTGATRTRGQQADALLQQLPSLEQQIQQLDAAGKLGPVAGRWHDFLVGKVGANDPDMAAFRSNLNGFIGGLSKAHLNTEQGVRDFENAIGGPHSTGANLLAALAPMKDLLQKYRNIGAGTPNGATAYKAGDTQTYDGATYKFKGGDWTQQANWEKQQ